MTSNQPDPGTDAQDDVSTPVAQSGITPNAVLREVRDFVRAHERRRRQFPRAALVGLIAGLLAVAFRGSLNLTEALRTSLVAYAHRYPHWGILLPASLGAIGGGLSVWLVRRFAPEASGSGIPHLKAVLHHLRAMAWRRILIVKFLGGLLSIGSGFTLGREGPTVQMGGAVGQMVSQWLKTTPRERQTLIAAGAGAGLAAAFNAPLAGMIFVLEEVQRAFTPGIFAAAFIASVVADIVTRVLLGQLPVFHVTAFPNPPPLESLPVFLVLGVLAGLLGVAFNRSLLGSLRLFDRTKGWPAGIGGALVGIAVGIVAWFRPGAVGGGQHLVELTLAGQMSLGVLPLLFAVRYGLTMLSYGSGAPGGIFAPLLVLGAQIGLIVGLIGQRIVPIAVPDPAMFAVVGMAAYFTAIVRAPLTGIVLIIEMTGNYNLMLPLLAACFSAYGIADLLGDRPIYEALLERDLLRSQDAPELEGILLLELVVLAGASFEGKAIGELALPPGCVIITVGRGFATEVATPDTILRAGDRITAVIAPKAARAVPWLREGMESARLARRRR